MHENTRAKAEISALQKLTGLLADRGYTDEDIALIMHGNWIRFLQHHLPS